MAGNDPFTEAIEAHYCQSAFVKEICVISATEPGQPTPQRPHAVVVPDMELMRARKITNVGDLLRFEIEGLSHLLPEHERVISYDVSFEPLPRSPAHQIERDVVARLVRERRDRSRQPDASLGDAERAWLSESDVAAAVAIIEARTKGRRVWPDANLEIDLGFDSMDRVELIAELESRCSTQMSQQQAAEILTVKQLIDAVRSAEARSAKADLTDRWWSAILRDRPAIDDLRLGWLLRKRTIAAPVLFVLLRVLRVLLVRARVRGLEHLPAAGPYIITPNHQSYVDPFILCGVLPYRVFKDLFFVGAVEYFETPFTSWVAHTANLVPVDPDSNLIPAMKAGAFGLAHGRILLLFPEGERSIDGTVKKFKKGAPILAQHLEVPAVPVALKGIHEVWPRNRGINWRLVAPWSGHRVTITIGEPVAFAAATSYADNASRLRDRVNVMWEAPSP